MRELPSAGSAEPTSPIYRQNTDPVGRTEQRNATNPSDRAPKTDPEIGGSGGTGGVADPLAPGEKGSLDLKETRSANSIIDEPNRVTRGGGATGKNIESCMQTWDAGTHMIKEQWRTTCERLGR